MLYHCKLNFLSKYMGFAIMFLSGYISFRLLNCIAVRLYEEVIWRKLTTRLVGCHISLSVVKFTKNTLLMTMLKLHVNLKRFENVKEVNILWYKVKLEWLWFYIAWSRFLKTFFPLNILYKYTTLHPQLSYEESIYSSEDCKNYEDAISNSRKTIIFQCSV